MGQRKLSGTLDAQNISTISFATNCSNIDFLEYSLNLLKQLLLRQPLIRSTEDALHQQGKTHV